MRIAVGNARVDARRIDESPAMHRVIDVPRRVAQVDSTILLTGESGVGKERIARFIHEESARAGGPQAARKLGIGEATLYRKIKKFGAT